MNQSFKEKSKTILCKLHDDELKRWEELSKIESSTIKKYNQDCMLGSPVNDFFLPRNIEEKIEKSNPTNNHNLLTYDYINSYKRSYEICIEDEELIKKLVNLNEDIDKINFIIDIIDFINSDNKDKVFNDFEFITINFNKTSLNGKEQFDIVMNLVKKNLENILYLNSCINDLYNASNQSNIEGLLLKMISSECNKYINEKLLPHYKNIKMSYFDKFDQDGNLKQFSNEDLKNVIESLRELGVTQTFADIAKNILSKEIEKKQSKSYDWVVVTTNDNKLLSEAEYKKNKKIINKYFDIHKGIVKRPLTKAEVFECANLMLRNGEDESIIRTLFDKGLTKLENPIGRYIYNYEKIKYYAEQASMCDKIELMDQIIQEIVSSSPEEYNIWKGMFTPILAEVESRVPQSYQYEMKKVKEYKKK